jgi:hypothetical protein
MAKVNQTVDRRQPTIESSVIKLFRARHIVGQQNLNARVRIPAGLETTTTRPSRFGEKTSITIAYAADELDRVEELVWFRVLQIRGLQRESLNLSYQFSLGSGTDVKLRQRVSAPRNANPRSSMSSGETSDKADVTCACRPQV